MKRWTLTVISGITLLGAVVGATLPAGRGEAAGQEVRALEFTVQNPAGVEIALHFTVRADSMAEAYEAAQAAAAQIVRGADLNAGDDRVTAAYAFWSHTWSPEQIPVPVGYNPAGAPAHVSEGLITAGIEPWNTVETSAFRIAYTGLTNATPGAAAGDLDGKNTIGWHDLDCSKGCVLGLAAAAQGEVDIILNSNPIAGLGDGMGFSIDTAWVVLHEVGHLAGLEHSCDPGIPGDCDGDEWDAVMFPLYRGGVRSLGADDIAGISALYPATGDGPAPGDGEAGAEVILDINAGWNLVVLPPGPLDATARALRCVDAVYTFAGGGWRVWIRNVPQSLNTLTTAEAGRAYWVHSTGTCGLSFTASS